MMEVLWFLKQRTQFIRRHYIMASEPFREIIRKIEQEEEPFVPGYSEDDEPPFLEEWIEASTSLNVVGAMCLSMLSESLKLYLKTWASQLGIRCEEEHKAHFKKRGFLAGYERCFGDLFVGGWASCPADLAIIEQVVLARNAAQHPQEITRLGLFHKSDLVRRHEQPLFISDMERRMLENNREEQDYPWLSMEIVVTEDALLKAVGEVEGLGDWLEERLFALIYPSHRPGDLDA